MPKFATSRLEYYWFTIMPNLIRRKFICYLMVPCLLAACRSNISQDNGTAALNYGHVDESNILRILNHIAGEQANGGRVFDNDILISKGSALIPVLLSVVVNPRNYPEPAYTAWDILQRFNDPRVLYEMARQARNGILSDDVLLNNLEYTFPVPNDFKPPSKTVSSWLIAQIESKGYDGTIVEMTGILLEDKAEQLNLLANDERFIRWFNLYDAEDFDQKLRAYSPSAWEFRNRMITERGIDPLFAFREMRGVGAGIGDVNPLVSLGAYAENQKLQDALNQMFNKNSDREACRKLFRFGIDEMGCSDDHVGSKLSVWYKEHKKELRFDFRLRRFVVERQEAIQTTTGKFRGINTNP